MNKSLYLLIASLFVFLLSFTSCKETTGIDQYADWQARNDSYLSFIASQANANKGEEVGQWKVVKSYLSNEINPSNINDYVYARINKKGNGATPIYSDSIAVCYRGSLISGVLFDKSTAFVPQNALSTDTLFAGKPNDSYGDIFSHVVYYPDLDILTPSRLKMSEVVVGWISALQQMKEGDYWTIYIPSKLGYGGEAKTSGTYIPGNSLLIFDLYLIRAYLK